MQKFLSIFLLLFLFATLVQAQSDADKVAANLQQRYNKIKSLTADFTQYHTARGGRPRKESGRLYLLKPGKMRWVYTLPEEKLFISNGKTIYEYVPSDKYAVKTKVKESDDYRVPFMFLLGRGNLKGEFKVIEYSKETPVKAGNNVLRLVPKRNLGFREVIVELEPVSAQISRVSLIENDGSRSDFLFSNLRENVHMKSDEFTFKAPVGVEIRDND